MGMFHEIDNSLKPRANIIDLGGVFSDCRTLLPKERSVVMKGVCATMVLLHHAYQFSGINIHPVVNFIFQNLGYLAVSVFLFTTGYGLTASVKKKGYLERFPRNRLLLLTIEYVILVFLYFVLELIIDSDVRVIETIKNAFILGKTNILGGWYLQVTILAYICFLLTCLTFKKASLRILLALVFSIVFCLICRLTNILSTYYECAFCLIVGVVVYEQKTRIESFLTPQWNKIIVLLLLVACSLGSLLLGRKTDVLFFKMLSSASFPLALTSLLTLLNEKITFDKLYVGRWFGNRSFDIYTLQGIPLLVFGKILKTGYIYFFLVIGGTLVLSALANPLRITGEQKWKRISF